MSNIQIFNNPEFGEIRTIDQNGEPWFVGKDVATALGYADPRGAISKKVDDLDRGVAKMATPLSRSSTRAACTACASAANWKVRRSSSAGSLPRCCRRFARPEATSCPR